MKREKTNWTPPPPFDSAPLPVSHPLPSLTPEVIARLGEHRKGIIAGFGIFKDQGVFPDDALTYQLEVRADWD